MKLLRPSYFNLHPWSVVDFTRLDTKMSSVIIIKGNTYVHKKTFLQNLPLSQDRRKHSITKNFQNHCHQNAFSNSSVSPEITPSIITLEL